MAKKSIKLNISAEDLKKKLKLKDPEPVDYNRLESKIDSSVKKEVSKIKVPKDGRDAPLLSEIVSETKRELKPVLEEMVPKPEDIANKIPLLGPRIRDSLELLQNDERLSMDAINGLEEAFKKIKKNSGESYTVTTTKPGAASDGKTKVSANDTTAGYLNGKLVAGTGITLQENSDGGNETLEIINSLSSIVVDTRATILASTPTSETVAYATDTKQFYVFDGTNWQESSSYFGERNANPNMGAVQDGNVNDIGRDFIANKRLSQIKLGGYSEELDSTFKSKGAIKGEDNEDTGDYEMSMWSTVSQTWRRFLAGISLRNDTPNQTLVSDDFSYFTMDLFTGDSLEVDFYGTPMVQWGKISMGAIQPPVTLSGGQF